MSEEHQGLQEFLRLADRYESLRERLEDFSIALLMPYQSALEAYCTDNGGWWWQCKREGLFPFAHAGDGDLLTLPKDSKCLVIFLHDYANDPEESAFWPTNITFEAFLEKMLLMESWDIEWLYDAVIP